MLGSTEPRRKVATASISGFDKLKDADIAIKELEAEDLLETIEEGVRQRKFGSVVRLQVNQEMPQHILQILKINLDRHQGTGSRRSAGNHRGGRAAAQVRQRGALAGESGDAAAHPADPQDQSRTGKRRGRSEERRV